MFSYKWKFQIQWIEFYWYFNDDIYWWRVMYIGQGCNIWIFCVILRGQTVILLNPGLGDKMVTNNTDNVLHSYSPAEEESTGRNKYLLWYHWLFDIKQWYLRFMWYIENTGHLISKSDIWGLCDIWRTLVTWYQTVISEVYVIYWEHWLFDIIQWYPRFIIWYQGLDSDIYSLLLSYNDIPFCLLLISMILNFICYHTIQS